MAEHWDEGRRPAVDALRAWSRPPADPLLPGHRTEDPLIDGGPSDVPGPESVPTCNVPPDNAR